jgi:hypothetical protein
LTIAFFSKGRRVFVLLRSVADRLLAKTELKKSRSASIDHVEDIQATTILPHAIARENVLGHVLGPDPDRPDLLVAIV